MAGAILRILHLEDNPLDAELIGGMLKTGGVPCEVERVGNKDLFATALRRGGFDMILADNSMPGFDGLSALMMALDAHPEVPFIFVSGTIGEDMAIEAVKLGATDYVVKDKPARLVPAVRRAMLEVNERMERQAAEERLRQSEEKLLHAQKMETIGTLAGGIAHDFNNILGIILGYASVLREGDVEPARLSKSLDAMISAVERGTALVRQLLTFARKSDVLFGLMNVNDAVEEVVTLCAETFPKTITCSRRCDPGVPPIVADHSQFHQALLNLCINARDAMPHGGTLSVGTSVMPPDEVRKRMPEARSDPYVCIAIADTGTGMDAETRARIFEPFFTTKGAEKGTGLGLAIVYGVVKSHQALVDVESQVGKGTTFRLYFPVGITGGELARPQEVALDDAPGGSETILLVEDEEHLALLAKLALEEKGYRVLSANDGMEAVELFSRHAQEIDLVLTDLGLPRLDGWEAYLRMKTIRPDVTTIVATGYTDPKSTSDMLRNGVRNVVQKPYLPKTLLQVVRETLDAAKGK